MLTLFDEKIFVDENVIAVWLSGAFLKSLSIEKCKFPHQT